MTEGQGGRTPNPKAKAGAQHCEATVDIVYGRSRPVAQRRSCPIVVLAVGSERHREKCLVDGGGRRREKGSRRRGEGGLPVTLTLIMGSGPFPSLSLSLPFPSFGTFPNEVPDYFVPLFLLLT